MNHWYKFLAIFDLSKLRRIKDDEELQFRLWTATKITLIPLVTFSFLILLILLLLKINLIFFESRGYPNMQTMKDTFYTYIFSSLLDLLPFVIPFCVLIFIKGLYVAYLMMRPFEEIGRYCDNAINSRNSVYDPDFFSDLKLLTRFSEFFFIETARMISNGSMSTIEVPKKFMRIHTPVFEGSFFIQFLSILMITSIYVGVAIHMAVVGIYEGMVKLSLESLRYDKTIIYFLEEQKDILIQISIVALVLHLCLYLTLSINLYSKVSAPAFGIFATMRAFIKGNRTARVHLIGYYYVRTYCRSLNQYLNNLERLSLQLKSKTEEINKTNS